MSLVRPVGGVLIPSVIYPSTPKATPGGGSATPVSVTDGFDGGPGPAPTGSGALTAAQKQLLSRIKDPVERARQAILFTLKNGGSVSSGALTRALSSALTADQANLLAKVKDPVQRAQMEAQFKLSNASRLGGFARKVAHRLPPAQQQQLLAKVADPILRARLQVAVDLRAGKPVTDAALAKALSAALTPAQQGLLANVKDPAQRAQLKGQLTLQNEAEVFKFAAAVGHRLTNAQQQVLLGSIRDPAARTRLQALWAAKAA